MTDRSKNVTCFHHKTVNIKVSESGNRCPSVVFSFSFPYKSLQIKLQLYTGYHNQIYTEKKKESITPLSQAGRGIISDSSSPLPDLHRLTSAYRTRGRDGRERIEMKMAWRGGECCLVQWE